MSSQARTPVLVTEPVTGTPAAAAIIVTSEPVDTASEPQTIGRTYSFATLDSVYTELNVLTPCKELRIEAKSLELTEVVAPPIFDIVNENGERLFVLGYDHARGVTITDSEGNKVLSTSPGNNSPHWYKRPKRFVYFGFAKMGVLQRHNGPCCANSYVYEYHSNQSDPTVTPTVDSNNFRFTSNFGCGSCFPFAITSFQIRDIVSGAVQGKSIGEVRWYSSVRERKGFLKVTFPEKRSVREKAILLVAGALLYSWHFSEQRVFCKGRHVGRVGSDCGMFYYFIVATLVLACIITATMALAGLLKAH